MEDRLGTHGRDDRGTGEGERWEDRWEGDRGRTDGGDK